MTTLVAGTAFTSRTPTVLIENRLAVGTWVFQLVVVDNDGNLSAPASLSVSVIQPRIPTPIPPSEPTPLPRPVPDT